MGKPDIRLLMVTDVNNNKFYYMHDNENGTFSATWGRYGTSGKVTTYDITKWDKTFREKTSKGYVDITKNTAKLSSYASIPCVEINTLLNNFLDNSRQYVSKYTEFTSISDEAAAEFQGYLNKMQTEDDLKTFNDYLIKLFTIIPRPMAKVQDYLCKDLKDRNAFIQKEQKLLDNLVTQTKSAPKVDDKKVTIEEAFGFTISQCSDDEIDFIKKKLANDGFTRFKFNKAWKLNNPKREEGFKKYLEEHKLGEDAIKMYWHGTGTENILSIMANGLLVRPSNVSYSGSCYGNGIYNAPNADKASGYTSIAGSCWKGGSSRVAYMFINAVIMGKQFDCKDNYEKFDGMPIHSLDEDKFTKHNLGYDSVYAHAGGYLKRDEAIVYNQNQVACRYLVEFSV